VESIPFFKTNNIIIFIIKNKIPKFLKKMGEAILDIFIVFIISVVSFIIGLLIFLIYLFLR